MTEQEKCALVAVVTAQHHLCECTAQAIMRRLGQEWGAGLTESVLVKVLSALMAQGYVRREPAGRDGFVRFRPTVLGYAACGTTPPIWDWRAGGVIVA